MNPRKTYTFEYRNGQGTWSRTRALRSSIDALERAGIEVRVLEEHKATTSSARQRPADEPPRAERPVSDTLRAMAEALVASVPDAVEARPGSWEAEIVDNAERGGFAVVGAAELAALRVALAEGSEASSAAL